ncbi:alpha/beta hydrolase [Sphingomonas sp. QA11]|uniref:alpha/beta hydrolase family protein n=1 Tax=Sphingomonas sp. QA11 TaxID=2950605 RepID=UPI0023490588|nr:alpha/beta hydrolase [Sphingomonas sp. QA11]WCM29382.1 alpha/beta hydrolase [Sphingomonas sp. QA11]
MFRLAPIALLALIPAVMTATAPSLLTWADLTARPQPRPDATIAYGDDDMQKVDVWLPAGKGPLPTPLPTVLMVHGGCWTTSIADRSLMNWIADDLRKDGIAVWNIDYRGVDRPGGGYPGTFLDTAAAADSLIAHAKRFHLDTGHIVAVGHSAGGHLALWLAARPKLPKGSPLRTATPLPIAHVISLGGLPDLEATAASPDNGCGTDVVRQLVGPPDTRPDVYADTSIPRLLPIGVPQDLVNGREDRIIPIRLGTGYEAKARQAGDNARLHLVPATGHVELVTPDTRAWAETRRLIRAALQR